MLVQNFIFVVNKEELLKHFDEQLVSTHDNANVNCDMHRSYHRIWIQLHPISEPLYEWRALCRWCFYSKRGVSCFPRSHFISWK